MARYEEKAETARKATALEKVISEAHIKVARLDTDQED